MTYEELCAENTELHSRLEEVNKLLNGEKDQGVVYNLSIYKGKIQSLLTRNMKYLDVFLTDCTSIRELDDFVRTRSLYQYHPITIKQVRTHGVVPWYKYVSAKYGYRRSGCCSSDNEEEDYRNYENYE